MACEAGLVPVVLGGDSRVLDLGRSRRLFSDAQRLARLAEQATCEHPTCDVPAAFSHAHHRTPWARGGATNKNDLQWLCPRHHALAHQAMGTAQPTGTRPPPPMRT